MDKFYSVGEFAKKTGTSIRTLHYYDEIHLLKPNKHPKTGHRKYSDKDLLTLQQIVTFKWLGYSLEQIAKMLTNENDMESLKESLRFQKQSFEQKKRQIERVLEAIDRTIECIEGKEQIETAILISFINSIQSEHIQKDWFAKHTNESLAEDLFNITEEEQKKLDQLFFSLTNRTKLLVGQSFHSEEVVQLIKEYVDFISHYTNEEMIELFKNIEDREVEELDVYSPFTKEEEKWLLQAFAYYQKEHGLPFEIDDWEF
ncbi:MerR family transcriptional regulator [Alkalihalobacillus sp. 1P02AB]|uniref:MerR family transcriptional regulator n=1 Tax=Alkalihalobacillus sp. 1P02AB TaxID=3132260 RepID=UPI0039A43295